MHHRASHAILMHRREFSTSRRRCEGSQRVAGPYGAIMMKVLKSGISKVECLLDKGVDCNRNIIV